MSDDFDKFEEEDTYPFKRFGSYGRFTASGSFPVDYVLTTFVPEELKGYLTFAKDINPNKLDFELMMQRDIDEDRVKNEIAPYINPHNGSAKISETVLFFPPLLAAIIPVSEKSMHQYYNAEEFNIDVEKKIAIRQYPNQFKVDYWLTDAGTNKYDLSYSEEAESKVVSIDRRHVRVNLKIALQAGDGVKLVVIDGQHRLKALIDIYTRDPKALSELVIPICLLFPGNSNKKALDQGGKNIPTVPEVFRKLFVDVNNTAKTVGGHFNILLSDTKLRCLIAKSFCSFVLEAHPEDGKQRLASIEWNIRTKKDSTQIKRKYSIASIGVIDQALKELFGEFKLKTARLSIIEYWLALERFPDLFVDEEGDAIDFNWDELTLSQKAIIEPVVKDEIVPQIYKLYFGIAEFNAAFEINKKVLEGYEEKAQDPEEGINYMSALDSILDYKATSNKDAKKKIDEFEELVLAEREAKSAPIIRYSIFHRGLFDLLLRLFSLGKKYNLAPDSMIDVAIYICNTALNEKGKLFERNNRYTTYSIFNPNGSINLTAKTKSALGDLLIAVAGAGNVSEEIVRITGIGADQKEKFKDELEKIAISAAQRFLDIYADLRKKSFEKSYPGEFGLTPDERAGLVSAHDELKEHLLEAKQKKRDRSEVSTKFEELVGSYVKDDVAQAYESLKKALSYDEQILSYVDDDEVDEVDEE